MSGTTGTKAVELTQATTHRLYQRCNDQGSVDDLIGNLLDETRDTVSLTEFVDRVVEAADPIQISLIDDFSSFMFFVVTTDSKEAAEKAIEGVHAIEVDGNQYPFCLGHDPDNPRDLGRVSLYTTVELTVQNFGGEEDGIKEPVSREEGVENAKEWVRTAEDLKPL